MADTESEILDEMPEYRKDLWGHSFVQRLIRSFDVGLEPVYHYTSAQGFAEIIGNNRIWVTNSAYLNDQDELTYPVRLALDTIGELWAATAEEDTRNFLQAVAQTTRSHEFFKSWYIACFSREGNQLSQWRAYCPGGGYSLGFDPRKLAEKLRMHSYLFGPVEYDREKQKSRIQETIEKHVEAKVKLRSKYPRVRPEEFEKEAVNTLGLALSEEFMFFKSKAFEEEREWRIVQYLLPPHEVKFRERNGILTPYLEADLSDTDGRLPITKIWVGPLGDQRLAYHAAELRLSTKGYQQAYDLLQSPGYSLRFT